MKQSRFALVLLLLVILTACAPSTPQPTVLPSPTATQTPTVVPSNTPEPTATSTPTPEPTPIVYGPSGFPAEVNPLTGLSVTDPTILNRRPIVIKVQNLPRTDRPQYGLSLADIVYEFYTELGSTRFAALYYGKDAEKVMPVRSARFPDINVIRMYKAVFVFGSAYDAVYSRLANSEFSDRLLLETLDSCPAICRFDPRNRNFIVVDTASLQDFIQKRGINNSRQNLDGMLFEAEVPANGSPADQVYVRFSGAVYNYWDYDRESGKYLRFSETADDINENNPQYAQLTDALNKEPISAVNVVTIFVRYTIADPRAQIEVLDVNMLGTGPAYIARDGQIYKVQWQRMSEDSVLTLINEDGTLFPFKPGNTWFEIMALNTETQQDGNSWKFRFIDDW